MLCMMDTMDVTAAVIFRDGLVLIGQRYGGGYYGGFWEFPGGKIECGEAPEECLKRELMEELGIHCTVGKEISRTVYDYPDRRVHLHAFKAAIDRGEPTALVHDELRWVKPADLATFTFVPADLPVIAAVLRLYK